MYFGIHTKEQKPDYDTPRDTLFISNSLWATIRYIFWIIFFTKQKLCRVRLLNDKDVDEVVDAFTR